MSAIIFISRQLSLTKKIFLGIIMMLQMHSAFADNENYDGQDVSGEIFKDKDMKDSSWVNTIAIGTQFTACDLENANFSNANLQEASFNSRTSVIFSNFNKAILTNSRFSTSSLYRASFEDAVIYGVTFRETKISNEQLYSTLNYKNKDLNGIRFEYEELIRVDFTGS